MPKLKMYEACHAAVMATLVTSGAAWAGNLKYQPGVDPVVGINLWQTSTSTLSGAGAVDEIQTMYNAGLRQVSLSPIAYVDLYHYNTTTNTADRNGTGAISTSAAGPGYGTMSDTQLASAITQARSLGMTVTVNPIIQPYVQGGGYNFSRARINFNPFGDAAEVVRYNQFWTDYRTVFTHWADIAKTNGATRFNVGSETEDLETNPDMLGQWTQTIDAVDAVLGNTATSPKLGYHSGHWKFDDSRLKTNIWSNPKIDYLATSAYFTYDPPQPQYNYPGRTGLASPAQSAGTLSDGDTFKQLVETNFRNWLNSTILPVGASVGKPIVLQEFGIAPFDTASSKPWEYYWYDSSGNLLPYDALEARNAIEGVLRSIDGMGANIEQINFWVWAWQGGFKGEPFGLRLGQTLVDDPSTQFDETKNQPASNLITSFVQSVPEPTSALGMTALAALVLRRRANASND
ncbi:MAG: PEP-CTERM sorting domain-containing protein [Tepidisphaeraceae bacterium]